MLWLRSRLRAPAWQRTKPRPISVVPQDFIIHQNEISSKLVAIMRERLSANIKQLPTVAAAWPSGPAQSVAFAPSSFVTTSAKQLQILSGVLSPLLLPSELHSIFGRVALMFSRTLAEAYGLLEPHGGAWQQQLRADVECMLETLASLPVDPAQRESNLEALAAFRHSLDGVSAASRQPQPAQQPSTSAQAASASAGQSSCPPTEPDQQRRQEAPQPAGDSLSLEDGQLETPEPGQASHSDGAADLPPDELNGLS